MNSRSIVVGVGGGSGAGKSTLVRALMEALGSEQVTVLAQDDYYRDRPDLDPAARRRINYDHPDAIDEPLLLAHLRALASGQPVECPAYDFTRHVRRPVAVPLAPRPCLIVEGILVLSSPQLRDALDLKLYVDTDADLRFIRRLRRDLQERGRSPVDVMEQYLASVRPMHLQFVEPSRRFADLILSGADSPAAALPQIVMRIQQALTETQRK